MPSLPRRTPAKAIAVVLLVAAVAKVNTLNAVFVWDDDSLICENVHVRNWRRAPGFFLPSFWRQHHMTKGEVYRPIRLASFAVDYALWGQNPRGYHLTNLLLHLLAVALVCGVLRKWPLTRRVWLPAALLFAVRPTDVETVAWIKNRADLFAAVFFFAAILVLPLPLGRERQWGRSLIGALLFALALMSKEVAIVLPALLVLLFTSTRRLRRGWAMTLPFWVVAAGYMLLRAHSLVTPPAAAPEAASPGLIDRIQASATTLLCYARVCLLPANMTLDHLPPSRMLFSGGPALLAAVLLAAAACAILVALRWRHGLAGVLWFAIALSPISNIIPLRDRPFAEQRLYVAALGLCVLLAAALCDRRRNLAWLVCLAVAASAALAVHRAGLWTSNVALWREAVLATPDQSRPLSNLGNAYLVAERRGRAVQEFRRTLRAEPKSTEAAFRLGQIHQSRGEHAEAMAYYRRVVEWQTRNVEARYAMAALDRERGRYAEAMQGYQAILALQPNAADAWHGIALLHDAQAQTREAIEACTKAIELDPTHVFAHRVRGVLLTPTDPAAAVRDLSAALEVDPDFVPAYLDRARAYMKLKDWDRARRDIDAAMLRDSTSVDAAQLLEEFRKARR